MFHGFLEYFPKPPLGGRSNTKPWDYGTPNGHNRWFILFYHVWRSAWIEIHWNSIRLRARSHLTSHYTWGSMTTLHDFEGVLKQSLGPFFWAHTISRLWLLASVWSGPKFGTRFDIDLMDEYLISTWQLLFRKHVNNSLDKSRRLTTHSWPIWFHDLWRW
jgi:hypothetical protein